MHRKTLTIKVILFIICGIVYLGLISKIMHKVPLKNEYFASKDAGVVAIVMARKKVYEKMSEERRARYFWDTTLRNEVRIATPQNLKCEFCIVVPVFNEKPERILKQIESLKNQNGFDPSRYEVIYVVNNDVVKGDRKSKEIVATNHEAMKVLRNVSGLYVHAIDKSSPGNEIVGCNLGKARNRGLAEASLRFYESGKNGIVIQTDADTYFHDPDYFKKLHALMSKHPDAIGVAGGIIFEFSPDTTDEKEVAGLQAKIEKFALMKKGYILSKYLRDANYISPYRSQMFWGANMVSKSYESAVIGGIIELGTKDDLQFYLDLQAYGQKKGQYIIEAKNKLLVVTAMRESDRTLVSFKKEFDRINLDEPIGVTEENYQKLLQRAKKDQKGSDLVDNLETIWGNVRISLSI